MDIRRIVDCRTILGEGPLWDPESGRLHWIDIVGGKIFRSDADGANVETWDTPEQIGSMALRRDGGAVVALADGFHRFDFETGGFELIASVEHAGPGIRINDGKADAAGRFVAGSIEVTETSPAAVLYSLGVDGKVSVIDRDITVSNGPCWSPDGSIFYFADSRSRAIWAYDYDQATGAATNKRRFFEFGPDDGLPDGATVDAEGCVWTAGVYASRILRISPEGRRLATIDFPVVCVTSVMFGGADLDRLYVTSMLRAPVPGVVETGPMAGSLFAIDGLGVRGLPEHRYGG